MFNRNPKVVLYFGVMLVLALPTCRQGDDAKLDTGSESGSESEDKISILDGPVTPAVADCSGVAYTEGDCAHPCVAASCTENWCRIPAGCYIFGSPDSEWMSGMYTELETPVTLTRDFAIRQYEMTRKEWTALGFPLTTGDPSATGFTSCVEDDCPLDMINFWEAAAAANRLSELHSLTPCYELKGCVGQVGEGMQCEKVRAVHASVYDCPGYRIPTQVEWEYAINAGTRTAFYSGEITLTDSGDTFDTNLDPIAWYRYNSGPDSSSDEPQNAHKTTHPVGQKLPNAWLLYDMSGNVSEWSWDKYNYRGFDGVPQTDPVCNEESERDRTLSGGQATSASFGCRSSSHQPWAENTRLHGFGGIRLVRTLTWPDGADTDTVPDTDTGTGGDDTEEPIDTDADHNPEDCPLNTGWPCSCNIPFEEDAWYGVCEDDESYCIYVDPKFSDANFRNWGVCIPQCGPVWPCPGSEYNAEEQCLLYYFTTAGAPDGCILTCQEDEQCPSDQHCVIEAFMGDPNAEYGFCYPFP